MVFVGGIHNSIASQVAKLCLCFKNGPTPTSFIVYFRSLQSLHFLQQIYVKNVHLVYGTGIQTHDLRNTSLLP